MLVVQGEIFIKLRPSMTSEITAPPPSSVRHNDWRSVDLEPPETFVPVLPVSVVIPYYEAPDERARTLACLARTLACLEMQSYPRDLFEVVIVDDGSRIPLEPPLDTPLDVRVVRQDDRGYGAGRARNNGVRAASHDIVLFLDCDILPESGWLEAHARWHHAVSDAVTVGFVNHVSVEGVDADTIRDRPGSLEELFSGRRVDRPVSNERILLVTDDLTSEDADYLFSVLWSGNFGVRRDFYRLIGGFDESFTEWGCEDTELGYRAYAWGGLLVPVREALGWHQGSWSEGRDEKERWLYLQRAKIAQLIPHREFRGSVSHRIFEVPGHVVTLEADDVPAERVLESAERVLADRAHDLVLNVRMSDGSDDFVWLERHLGADPRVRIGPSPDSLDDFPSAPFHVVLHAGSALEPDTVHRLRTELGSAASATWHLSDGSTASIFRSWALHRARRSGRPVSDFGDAAVIPSPPPSSVRHNDWRSVDLEPLETFVPVLPVSVVIPYYEAPDELARTLACLEMQSYPRDLFEVVIVDDGSRIPLEPPLDTPLDVRVLHQDDRGFGLARARNNGVRAAAHGIVLFLDCDILPESGWLEAHARWHHAVSDAVTVGFVNHVSVEGVDADTIRDRPGSLEELFSGRRVDRPVSNERTLLMTDDLTSEDSDYSFDIVWGGNFGVRRDFYRLIGGSDESFTQWGGEDTELGYRAYAWGGLLVPVREALGWHQGSWSEGREEKERLQRLHIPKVGHLIPHRLYRRSVPGRIFEVPGHAVTLEADGVSAEGVLESAERVLADQAHDLVLIIRMADGSDDFLWLERHLGPDPRVRIGPSLDSLDEFPSTPFHVVLHAGSALEPDTVHRLRTELGSAASATWHLSDGSTASIFRSWALHRARRSGRPVSDFGDAAVIPSPPAVIPSPPPSSVRHNDWRSVDLEPLETFVPVLPVSVVIPYYEAPDELARTLACLEMQSYPRDLFEVVIVDDGSRTPLEPPLDTPLDVRVLQQDDRGFGAARARNNGVRAAAHDIVLFLDCDILPESGWLEAHARWHHAVSDAVTVGFVNPVSVEGVDADTIRDRPGSLEELFAGRPTDLPWYEPYMVETDDLTAENADDLFRVVISNNFGMRRDFYWLIGGFDESFTEWGWEDTELGYRAYAWGGLLVPVREALGWHQRTSTGLSEEGQRWLYLRRAKVAQLIPHREFRGSVSRRIFEVPGHVVTLEADDVPAERVLDIVERVLADRACDLVLNVRMSDGGDDFVWLERHLGGDPRVRIGPSLDSLEDFPSTPFHVVLPAGSALEPDAVHRLRTELGSAASATWHLSDGSTASIVRSWALHRARRTGRPVSDFGDAAIIPSPPPASVRYNDWRGIDLDPPDTFVPVLPVSVVIPYYEAPEELARTLACLEMQSYPRDLFEVVIVDDGSHIPLEPPLDTPLDVRVLHQDDRGYGAARARNNGVRAAAHDIVLFLDCDVLPESGWLEAHARWHHAVSDAVTIGFRNNVSVEGVDAEMIRDRPGSLEDLFAGLPTDLPWYEPYMARTDDLTAENDDGLFHVVTSGNLGIRRDFFRLIGGFDESFTEWAGEDTELGYRAYAWGGLLVPVREALGWHQRPSTEATEEGQRLQRLQRPKTGHLIPHREFRDPGSRRIFEVPGHAVTLESDGVPAERVLESAERVLADRACDLVLNVRMSDGSDDFVWLERHLGADPRVRVGPSPDSLDDFPSTPFHVVLHAGSALEPDAVHRLRTELGSAASATCLLSDGSTVSIGRSWALHRARRTGRPVSDFGDAAVIPASKLEPGISGITVPQQPTVFVHRGFRAKAGRVLSEARRVRSPGQAWRFLKWFGGAVIRRIRR